LLPYSWPAAADAADDQFVNALAAQGITGARGTIIAAGHTVCDDVAPRGFHGARPWQQEGRSWLT